MGLLLVLLLLDMPVVEVGKPRASSRFHAPSGCSNVRNVR
jgi:hypothetical protein